MTSHKHHTNGYLSPCEEYLLGLLWTEPVYSLQDLAKRCQSDEERSVACDAKACADAVASGLARGFLEVVTEASLSAARAREAALPALRGQTGMTFVGATILSRDGAELSLRRFAERAGETVALDLLAGWNQTDDGQVELLAVTHDQCQELVDELLADLGVLVGVDDAHVVSVEPPRPIGRWLTHWYIELEHGYRAVVRFEPPPIEMKSR